MAEQKDAKFKEKRKEEEKKQQVAEEEEDPFSEEASKTKGFEGWLPKASKVRTKALKASKSEDKGTSKASKGKMKGGFEGCGRRLQWLRR